MKTTKTIVAIGGGELKDLDTLLIDQAIVRLVKKRQPRVLFIPTASNDAIGYWEVFKNVYGEKLGCRTDKLLLLKEQLTKAEIEGKIFSADIIYVGGGNTLRMLRVWRKYGVDVLLKKAYEEGVVLAGLSAGAISWFRYGVSDSRRLINGKQKDVRMRVSGLDLVPCTVSPHHIREKKLQDKGLADIMKRTSGVGLAIDDSAAILLQNETFEVLRSKKESGIKKVFNEKGKIKRVPLEENGSLESLFSKNC